MKIKKKNRKYRKNIYKVILWSTYFKNQVIESNFNIINFFEKV